MYGCHCHIVLAFQLEIRAKIKSIFRGIFHEFLIIHFFKIKAMVETVNGMHIAPKIHQNIDAAYFCTS